MKTLTVDSVFIVSIKSLLAPDIISQRLKFLVCQLIEIFLKVRLERSLYIKTWGIWHVQSVWKCYDHNFCTTNRATIRCGIYLLRVHRNGMVLQISAGSKLGPLHMIPVTGMAR